MTFPFRKRRVNKELADALALEQLFQKAKQKNPTLEFPVWEEKRKEALKKANTQGAKEVQNIGGLIIDHKTLRNSDENEALNEELKNFAYS